MRKIIGNKSLHFTPFLSRLVIDYILIPIFFLILIAVLFYFFDKAGAMVAQSVVQVSVPDSF